MIQQAWIAIRAITIIYGLFQLQSESFFEGTKRGLNINFSAIFRLAKPAIFSGTMMEKVRVEHKTGLAKCGMRLKIWRDVGEERLLQRDAGSKSSDGTGTCSISKAGYGILHPALGCNSQNLQIYDRITLHLLLVGLGICFRE